MNNCVVSLNKGVSSKTQKEYYYLSFVINGKAIKERIYIKETEVMYYQDLLK